MRAAGMLYIKPATVGNLTIDGYTRKMAGLLTKAAKDPNANGYFAASSSTFTIGVSSKDRHVCCCGAASTTGDYLVGELNSIAVVTNGLAVHYLAYHREDVPWQVFRLLDRMVGKLLEPTPELLQVPKR